MTYTLDQIVDDYIYESNESYLVEGMIKDLKKIPKNIIISSLEKIKSAALKGNLNTVRNILSKLGFKKEISIEKIEGICKKFGKEEFTKNDKLSQTVLKNSLGYPDKLIKPLACFISIFNIKKSKEDIKKSLIKVVSFLRKRERESKTFDAFKIICSIILYLVLFVITVIPLMAIEAPSIIVYVVAFVILRWLIATKVEELIMLGFKKDEYPI